jgi:hypothetical protein
MQACSWFCLDVPCPKYFCRKTTAGNPDGQDGAVGGILITGDIQLITNYADYFARNSGLDIDKWTKGAMRLF